MTTTRSAEAGSSLWRGSNPIIGWGATISLLCEIVIFCVYFVASTLLMLVSPVILDDANMLTALVHLLVAAGWCVAFILVVGCAVGWFRHKTLAKWYLLSLSALCMSPLPIALYGGLQDIEAIKLLTCLAGMGAAVSITTVIAFFYIESRPTGRQTEIRPVWLTEGKTSV